MSSKSKSIGTRAETKVARYLTAHGLPTERKALAGSNDKGDLRMLLPDGTEVTVEVKAGRQTSNPSRSQMNDWKHQTIVEALNSDTSAILCVVRYRRAFKDAEVWIPNVKEYSWTMMYIDDFAKQLVEGG